MAAVPSGEPSSMISMSNGCSSPNTARMMFSMFSFSLYVGMITTLSERIFLSALKVNDFVCIRETNIDINHEYR